MNAKERAEHARLLALWARGRATRKQVMRCMELDSKARVEATGTFESETIEDTTTTRVYLLPSGERAMLVSSAEQERKP